MWGDLLWTDSSVWMLTRTGVSGVLPPDGGDDDDVDVKENDEGVEDRFAENDAKDDDEPDDELWRSWELFLPLYIAVRVMFETKTFVKKKKKWEKIQRKENGNSR